MSDEIVGALITVAGGLVTGLVTALISNWHNLFPRTDQVSSNRSSGRNKPKQGRGPITGRVRYFPTAMALLLGAVVTSIYLQWSPLSTNTNVNAAPSFSTAPDAKPLDMIVFRDDFETNTNRWMLATEDERQIEIREGAYRLRSTSDNTVSVVPIPEIRNGDFQIDARVRKLSGTDQYFFGLVWGHRDDDNFANLAITGNGRAAVTLKRNRMFTDYANNRYFREEVHKGNSVNALRIEKRGNEMRFFVNNYLVEQEMDAETVLRTFAGDGVGFVVYNSIDLEFDYLIVSKP